MKIIKYIFLALLFVLTILVISFFILNHFQEPYEVDNKLTKELSLTRIKLEKGYVNYELQGPDTGKVVVLIHGAGAGQFTWDKNFKWLASEGYRVLRLDLYGRGYSDRVKVDYDLDLFINQLDQLLDTLQLTQKKINIAAVSMGCTVALEYADKHKEVVDQLILIDPASMGMGPAPWYISTPFVSDLLFTFYWRPRAVEKQMKEFYNPSAVTDFRVKTTRQMKYKGFKDAVRSTWIHTSGLDMTQQLKNISKSNISTHLIWGRQDPLVPYKASEQYLELIPNSTINIINKAGHLSNYERADTCNLIMDQIFKQSLKRNAR